MNYEVIDSATRDVVLDVDRRPFIYNSKARAKDAAARLTRNFPERSFAVQPVKTPADAMKANSSATYKWALSVIRKSQWAYVGFFKSEKAAKQFAVTLGVSEVLIGRRYEMRELLNSRNM